MAQMDFHLTPEQLGLLVCYYCKSYVLNNYHECKQCQYCICFECYRRVSNCPRCNNKFHYHQDIGFQNILDDIRVDQIAWQQWNFDTPFHNPYNYPLETITETDIEFIQDRSNSTIDNFQHNSTSNLTDDVKNETRNNSQFDESICSGTKKKLPSENCPLRDYENCTWKGCTKKDIIRHCDRNHCYSIYHTNRKVLRMKEFEARNCLTTDMCVLFVAFNELFRFYSQTNYQNNVVKWQCYYAGNKKFLKRFHYEISFQKVHCSNEEVVIRAPCQLWKDDVPDFENFIMLSYETLRQFCHGGDLYCCVRIFDKNYFIKKSNADNSFTVK